MSKKNHIENKIKREEYKISELLDKPKFSKIWHFENPIADHYRRSMVPFYLLVMESNKYPIYIDNSNLNGNLTNDFKIRHVTVHVSSRVLLAAEESKKSFQSKK